MTCKERILSNEYADFITDYINGTQIEGGEPLDFCYHAIDSGIGISSVRRSQIPPMSIAYYGYSTIPCLYGLMQFNPMGFNPEPLASTGSIRVQNPPLSLKGKGVILGFVDTGIRYQMDVFRNQDGSSRIMSIWDQTIQTGNRRRVFSMARNTPGRRSTRRLRRRIHCRPCLPRTRMGTGRRWLRSRPAVS